MKHFPLIGVTASWTPFVEKRPVFPDGSFDYLKNDYTDSVADAGGIPIIIPNLERENWKLLDPLIRRLDGLLFSGGSDITPDLFGQEEIPGSNCIIRRRRDEFEMELMRRWDVIRPHGPILAICRGHQLLNIHNGGTLIQDFGACGVDVIPEGHRTPEKRRTYHEVGITKGGLLAEIMGEGRTRVNSSHHQAIDKLAENFRAVAFADDGIIEAIEPIEPGRWVLSIQWHPEALSDDASAGIFEAFVKASANMH